jgi:hypothetical protein
MGSKQMALKRVSAAKQSASKHKTRKDLPPIQTSTPIARPRPQPHKKVSDDLEEEEGEISIQEILKDIPHISKTQAIPDLDADDDSDDSEYIRDIEEEESQVTSKLFVISVVD